MTRDFMFTVLCASNQHPHAAAPDEPAPPPPLPLKPLKPPPSDLLEPPDWSRMGERSRPPPMDDDAALMASGDERADVALSMMGRWRAAWRGCRPFVHTWVGALGASSVDELSK